MADTIVPTTHATKPCEHCETPFHRRPQDRDSRWRERRFCGRKCASLHARQSNTSTDETLIENLLWLIDPTAPRISNNDVAQRLKFNRVDSLYRRLYRADRPDLASLVLARDNPEVSAKDWWDLYVTAIASLPSEEVNAA